MSRAGSIVATLLCVNPSTILSFVDPAIPTISEKIDTALAVVRLTGFRRIDRDTFEARVLESTEGTAAIRRFSLVASGTGLSTVLSAPHAVVIVRKPAVEDGYPALTPFGFAEFARENDAEAYFHWLSEFPRTRREDEYRQWLLRGLLDPRTRNSAVLDWLQHLPESRLGESESMAVAGAFARQPEVSEEAVKVASILSAADKQYLGSLRTVLDAALDSSVVGRFGADPGPPAWTIDGIREFSRLANCKSELGPEGVWVSDPKASPRQPEVFKRWAEIVSCISFAETNLDPGPLRYGHRDYEPIPR